jgi:putative spermidine/putrescine transport system permease protein
MPQAAETDATARPASPAAGRRLLGAVPASLAKGVGVLPFFVFAALFLVIPTLYIVVGAFRDGTGGFTLANFAGLNTPRIVGAYLNSVIISLVSALIGCAVGFAMAAAAVFGGLPRWIRSPLLTFSGVASNFAGVPLAFAFIATIGPAGLVTLWLRSELGINLRAGLWRPSEESWLGQWLAGWSAPGNFAESWLAEGLPFLSFNLLSLSGLVLTYLFFQIPLMILIITPALDGLKREWREAAMVLGASGAQYWRMVALPILFPSLLGTFALLFANSFGAVATAFALAGPQFNLVPIQLFAQIRGDVLGNPNLGYALATGMILITAVANTIYILLRVRSERWLK